VGIVQRDISTVARIPVGDVEVSVSKQLPVYLPTFKQYAPIRSETFQDQYFFDITIYLSYLFAQTSIPTSEARVYLRERVGQDILSTLKQRKLVTLPTRSSPSTAAAEMSKAASGISSILTAFKSTGLIESFRFDAEDMLDMDYVDSLFIDVSLIILYMSCSHS
jgi:hypothetical protein